MRPSPNRAHNLVVLLLRFFFPITGKQFGNQIRAFNAHDPCHRAQAGYDHVQWFGRVHDGLLGFLIQSIPWKPNVLGRINSIIAVGDISTQFCKLLPESNFLHSFCNFVRA